MSGYHVFQAYDGLAAQELCQYIPEVDLLVLNTEGTGMDTPRLVRSVRKRHPRISVLHIGKAPIPGMPEDVLNLPDSFGVDELLQAVRSLVPERKDLTPA